MKFLIIFFMFFNYYNAPITNLVPTNTISLVDIHRIITDDWELAKLTDQYRSYAVSKSERPKFKREHFPYVTFSGTFSSRNDKSLISYSGFVCIDCDNLTRDELQKIRAFVSTDEYVLLGFTSPSEGYKIVIKSDSIDKHSEIFNAYRQYLSEATGIELGKMDSSCVNVSRACFICRDYYAYINPLVLDGKIDQVPLIDVSRKKSTAGTVETTSSATTNAIVLAHDLNAEYSLNFEDKNLEINFRALMAINEKAEGKYGSPREPWIQKLASLCNHFGMEEKNAEEYVLKYFEKHPESLNPQKPIDVQRYLVLPVRDVYKRYADQFDSWQVSLEETKYETPFLPDSVFVNLPPFLKKLFSLYDSKRERDMVFLATLTVLSSCFPNYWGIYDNKKYCANLFLFISASASSGKGRISAVRNLGNALQKRLDEIYYSQLEEYEEKLSEYKSAKKEDGDKAELPIKPKEKRLFLPANTTSARLIERLMRNENFAILMDTEADTLSQSFKSEHGNYSDILRKGFQHEAVSSDRKTNDELNHIERAFLSVIISGTPNQANSLIHSVENGLLSRFMFYAFTAIPHWRDVFMKMEILPEDYCGAMSLELLSFADRIHAFEKLNEGEKGIEFVLKDDNQRYRFNELFERQHDELYRIYGEEIIPSVKRMGLITYRIAMILSIIRLKDSDEVPQIIECAETDLNIALEIMECLIVHTIYIYNQLKSNKKTKNNKKPITIFYDKLPATFSWKEACDIADMLMIKHKTAEYYVAQYIKDDILERQQHSQYAKK